MGRKTKLLISVSLWIKISKNCLIFSLSNGILRLLLQNEASFGNCQLVKWRILAKKNRYKLKKKIAPKIRIFRILNYKNERIYDKGANFGKSKQEENPQKFNFFNPKKNRNFIFNSKWGEFWQ